MEVKIERFDHFGSGIALIDGVVTFIPKTIPGDTVLIELLTKKKSFNKARLLKVVDKSPKRIEAKCPFYDLCGGCHLQNLNYIDTLKFKEEKVLDIFRKINVDIDPIVIKNDHEFNYRNKIELKVKNGKIGFYEASTNNLVEINSCLITSEAINKVIPYIPSWNITNGEVTLRCNKNEEILIIIKTKDNLKIDIDSLKTNIKLVGIVHNNKTIYGENFLYEQVNGIIYRISYDSFFQVNPYVAEKLFEIVSSNVSNNEKILDLYSGVGTLSLSASKSAKEVLGIEIVPNAVLNAVNNAKINKIDNTHFLLNDVNKAISKIEGDYSTWLIDPPRAGIDKTTMEVITNRLPKKIVYVSCDPETLVRDINILKENYDIKKVYIVDMFSYTYHVECVALLYCKNEL